MDMNVLTNSKHDVYISAHVYIKYKSKPFCFPGQDTYWANPRPEVRYSSDFGIPRQTRNPCLGIGGFGGWFRWGGWGFSPTTRI